MRFKVFIVALAAAAIQTLCGTAHGATIFTSVNFQGGDTVGLATGDTTGAPAAFADHWNNITGAAGGPVTTLVDSTGSSSDVTLTSYSSGPFGVNGPDTDNSTAQNILFGGGLGDNFGSPLLTASFTISGLSAYSSYDVLAYYSAGNFFAQNRNGSISDGTSTYYVAGTNDVYTAFTPSNSTAPGTFSPGNYVDFTGLTGASQTITLNYGNDNLTLAGFQVVGTAGASVPEPASLSALAIGGMGLLARRRRIA